MMKTVWMGVLGATLLTAAMTATVAHSAAASDRSYNAGRFVFEVDGEATGDVRKVSGGGLGSTPTQGTTIAHEPLTMEIGTSMGKSMYEWIKASWDHGFQPRDLKLEVASADRTVTKVREFGHAYITEVTVPALDGSSKDPAYFTITLDPEIIRYAKPDGKIAGDENKGAKKWLASNFRLELDGLPCTRVAKIDSFSWEQKTSRDKVGKFREPTKHPKISNIRVTIGMADYDAWARWHKRFVSDGKGSGGDDKSGSLTFLGPDHKEELMTIQLDHVGSVSLKKRKHEKGAPARFVATLSVKGLELAGGK